MEKMRQGILAGELKWASSMSLWETMFIEQLYWSNGACIWAGELKWASFVRSIGNSISTHCFHVPLRNNVHWTVNSKLKNQIEAGLLGLFFTDGLCVKVICLELDCTSVYFNLQWWWNTSIGTQFQLKKTSQEYFFMACVSCPNSTAWKTLADETREQC